MLLVDKKTGELKCSPYSKFMHETIGRESGSMIIQHQDFSWDNDKRDFIVVDGEKEDRQALIDSFAEECGVYNILKKFSRTGDLSILNQKQGFYGDISDLPVDELNPAAREAEAQKAVASLSAKLGVDITSEDLAKMSVEEINQLIAKAVEAKTVKAEKVEESKGE